LNSLVDSTCLERHLPWSWTWHCAVEILSQFPLGCTPGVFFHEVGGRWADGGNSKYSASLKLLLSKAPNCHVFAELVNVATLQRLRSAPEHSILEAHMHAMALIPGTSVEIAMLSDDCSAVPSVAPGAPLPCYLHQRFGEAAAAAFFREGCLVRWGALRLALAAPISPSSAGSAPGRSVVYGGMSLALLPSEYVVPVLNPDAAIVRSFEATYAGALERCQAIIEYADRLWHQPWVRASWATRDQRKLLYCACLRCNVGQRGLRTRSPGCGGDLSCSITRRMSVVAARSLGGYPQAAPWRSPHRRRRGGGRRVQEADHCTVPPRRARAAGLSGG